MAPQLFELVEYLPIGKLGLHKLVLQVAFVLICCLEAAA